MYIGNGENDLDL